MGQMSVGILYGVEPPKALQLYEGADDVPGLLEEYGDTCLRKDCPDTTPDADKDLLGCWVAVAGDGSCRYCATLENVVALADLKKHVQYSKALNVAKKRWDRFTKWVAKYKCIQLPKAKLWIAPTEIA